MDKPKKNSVLIVDDDTSSLMGLIQILQPEYQIYTAKDGASALKRAEKSLPDLILLDVIMPDMNGFEVLTELKKFEKTKAIPVIFITGISEHANESTGWAIGAVDYIRKPFDTMVVKHRIRHQIQIINLQRDLEYAAKIAATANQSKSEYLAKMSHEIRTPMNAIIGMTNIGKSAANMERMTYCFVKIEDASKHLLGIINDILDISKIEAGKFELAPAEFNFESMLQLVVNVVNFRVGEKEQKLSVYVDRDIPQFLICDEQRLAQIITNLLGNAVKFTPEKGAISLSTYFLGEENGICTIKISVKDSGIGINLEQQAKLFQSFQQAESTTSREFGGTGLGLAISKSIVEMMGGAIEVESAIGKGSTFTFTVQAERGGKKPRIYSDHDIHWKNVRILAVDGDSYILEDLKRIVEGLGVSCDLAESAKDALRLVEQSGPYRIYFINWKIPDIDGIELTKKLKKRTPTQGEPVIILTSSTDISMVAAEAKEAGVDKFLQKPFFPSTIADIISESLGVAARQPEKADMEIGGIFHGRHILLVEDVEVNREIVLTLLEPTDLAIDCAVNGMEAVRMFSEAPDKYEMIFMDVQMPEMDGYEATRRIRAIGAPNAGTVPIIAMTANVFKGDIEKCLEAGMNGHVGKPLDLDALFAELYKYLTPPAEIAKMRNVSALARGIVWHESFLLGDTLVDMQHQEIFALVNNLVRTCEDGSNTEKLGETLNFLADYAVRHFIDEEALLLKHNYPEYAKHSTMHKGFKATVDELVQRFKEGGASVALSNKINNFAVRWLINHIQKEDIKIREYIRSKPRI